MKIRTLLLFLLLCTSITRSDASHLMGGEITWECLGSGQFKFHMKIYKDCWQQGTNNFPVQATGFDFYLDVTNHPSLTQVPMHLVDSVDVSPKCNVVGPQFDCYSNLGNASAMEFNFESNPITISGVPPAAGWVFSWGRNCCRNASILNLNNPAGTGMTLRAVMYPYFGKNTFPCYDNSPVFAQKPEIALCAGHSFTYNHNAFDKELDSLEYSWGQPLRQSGNAGGPGDFNTAGPIPFSAGYSYVNPFPSAGPPPLNPLNVAAVLNASSGEITFTSYTYGYFVTVIKVSAYRCGIKVADVYRDIQVILLNCGFNNPPLVYPPFDNGTSYDTTVFQGAVVDFKLLSVDSDWNASGSAHQWLSFTASGAQFGTGFTDPNSGCLHPPCATLNNPPVPGTDSTQFHDSIYFHWQTTCDHINYETQCNSPVLSNKYTFVISAKDDNCPTPGVKMSTITITVKGKPLAGTPDFRCASVLPNGDVSLSWIPPPDPGNTFADYYIYSATSAAGPYLPIDSSIISLATNSFVHVGANANNVDRFYMLKTRSGCFGKVHSAPSDTLQAIRVHVANPGTGEAIVTWNPLRVPLLPTASTGYYRIFRKIDAAGAWTLIDSTLNTAYTDPIFKCNDTVSYRVELDDLLPCTSVSSEDDTVFFDATPPETPVIDSVSIDPATGLIHLGWQVNPSVDVRGYLIYHVVNNMNVFLDTVFGINNTVYTTAFAAAGVDTFRVIAYDSCANISPFSVRHRTVWLTAKLNSCLRAAILHWDDYINWPGGVTRYDIYSSENGAGFTYLGSSDSTGFYHMPINTSSTYQYYVRAFSDTTSEESTSNYATLVAAVLKLPSFLYVRTATVAEEKMVRIDCHVDVTADVHTYKILRAVELNGAYDTIKIVTSTGLPLVSVFDTTADPSVRSIYYRAVAIDDCGGEHGSDNYGKTILLRAKPNDDLTNSIYFSNYENWSGGVEKYQVYRNVSGVWESQPFADIMPGDNVYRDDISSFITTDGNFCYYVKATEGAGNVYGFADTSLSNIACVVQGPRLYTPNAFTPGGKNPVFYPINAFVDVSTYQFVVFDRWGQTIFETSDPKTGWDGTAKGEEVANGVYVYMLRLTGTNKKTIERKGTISLIR